MPTSEHFSDKELACHHCGKNECSPGLVDDLETLRAAVKLYVETKRPGTPFKGLIVDDAYRCAEHNSGTPNAAKNSVHVLGLAADVRVEGMTSRTLERIARGLSIFSGIGRDDFRQYIHVDVGVNAGAVKRPASWCYDREGASTTYYA